MNKLHKYDDDGSCMGCGINYDPENRSFCLGDTIKKNAPTMPRVCDCGAWMTTNPDLHSTIMPCEVIKRKTK